ADRRQGGAGPKALPGRSSQAEGLLEQRLRPIVFVQQEAADSLQMDPLGIRTTRIRRPGRFESLRGPSIISLLEAISGQLVLGAHEGRYPAGLVRLRLDFRAAQPDAPLAAEPGSKPFDL